MAGGDAVPVQGVGELVGPGLELAVGELGVLEADRDPVRVVAGEHVVQQAGWAAASVPG